ncbi:unnamed protein product, partial [Gordionus sp. m RMFG-2023]
DQNLKSKSPLLNNSIYENSYLMNTSTIWYKETINKFIKTGALNRIMYILIGMTSIVLLYFLIKAIRIKKQKVKKYGILNGGDLDYDEEWGDNWLRSDDNSLKKHYENDDNDLNSKNQNKSKSHLFVKTKPSNNKRSEYSLLNNKWEMTPLDKFDPDMPVSEDDDGSDLDLFKASPAKSIIKNGKLENQESNNVATKQTSYKSTTNAINFK